MPPRRKRAAQNDENAADDNSAADASVAKKQKKEEERVEVIACRYLIDDEHHPFTYLHKACRAVELKKIFDYNQNITKEDVSRFY